VDGTEWKLLQKCIGRVIFAGFDRPSDQRGTTVDQEAHMVTTTILQLYSLMGTLTESWPTAANDFARMVVAELDSFVGANAVGDGGTTITKTLANYITVINDDVVLFLHPDRDIVYKIIQSFEGVEELANICIAWCERFLSDSSDTMTDSDAIAEKKKTVDALSVKGYLLSCSDNPVMIDEGMDLMKQAMQAQPKAGLCLFRFLKTTIKQLSAGNILPWVETVDSLLFNAQEHGLRSNIALRLFEDVAHFVVNSPNISTDVRASVLVEILGKWLRVQCRPGTQASTKNENPQFSVFGLLKAMLSQLEITVLSEACSCNRGRLVGATLSAVDNTLKVLVENTSIDEFGTRKDLAFISEQTWNLGVQIMATADASDIFARAHDLHLLSSGEDTAGFLDLDRIIAGSTSVFAHNCISERRSCSGSSGFSTMCLLVSVTSGLDHVERFLEERRLGILGEIAEAQDALQLDALLQTIVHRCNLLALSLKACRDDFQETNRDFVAYVTLTTLALAKKDCDAAEYAREHRKSLVKFFTAKFENDGDVASVESLVRKCQGNARIGNPSKLETQREVLSIGMEMIFALALTPEYRVAPPQAMQMYGRFALSLLYITKELSSPEYSFGDVCKDVAAKIISSADGVLFSRSVVTSITVMMYNASVRLAYCAGADKNRIGEDVRDCAASIVAFSDDDFKEGLGREVTAAATGAEGGSGEWETGVVSVWAI
jgi:hypothetical protein